MNYRRLTGTLVSEVGFGTWGIGGGRWSGGDDATALAALHRAVDLGLNFFDTALAYGQGHSERLLARLRSERSERLFIATKIPPKTHEWPARHGSRIADVFPKSHIVSCTEASLRNLGVERIDCQQLHVWAKNWAEEDEWHDALTQLRQEGKIAHFGISINDHEPDTALAVVQAGKVDTVQVIYNVFDPTPALRLFPLCVEKKVGVIVRCPFDEGGLTGRIAPTTVFEPGDWREDYFTPPRRAELEGRLRALKKGLPPLAEGGMTLPMLALRFCLSHPAVSTVIPGMRRTTHVEENLAASDAGPLSDSLLKALADHSWPRNFY